MQAELAWAREQLDRERSRSNGASSLEQRRAMLELAQQSQQVNGLQGKFSPYRSLPSRSILAFKQSSQALMLCHHPPPPIGQLSVYHPGQRITYAIYPHAPPRQSDINRQHAHVSFSAIGCTDER